MTISHSVHVSVTSERDYRRCAVAAALCVAAAARATTLTRAVAAAAARVAARGGAVVASALTVARCRAALSPSLPRPRRHACRHPRRHGRARRRARRCARRCRCRRGWTAKDGGVASAPPRPAAQAASTVASVRRLDYTLRVRDQRRERGPQLRIGQRRACVRQECSECKEGRRGQSRHEWRRP